MLLESFRILSLRRLAAVSGRRHASSQREVLSKGILVPKGPIAEQLAATNVWKTQRSKVLSTVKGEKTRINVTSEKLCRTSHPLFFSSFLLHAGSPSPLNTPTYFANLAQLDMQRTSEGTSAPHFSAMLAVTSSISSPARESGAASYATS